MICWKVGAGRIEVADGRVQRRLLPGHAAALPDRKPVRSRWALGPNASSTWSSCCVGATCDRGSDPPSGSLRAERVTGRELDVGLAQQRLLAQDGPGIGRHRRVLGRELHGDQRVHAAVGHGLHPPHVHAGDADVGSRLEQPDLGEARGQPVALGREGDRAAELGPHEHGQQDAGEREAEREEDARCGGVPA